MFEGHGPVGLDLFLPEMAVGRVDRDPENPGREGRGVWDIFHMAEDLEEDVLEQVLGGGPGAES